MEFSFHVPTVTHCYVVMHVLCGILGTFSLISPASSFSRELKSHNNKIFHITSTTSETHAMH